MAVVPEAGTPGSEAPTGPPRSLTPCAGLPQARSVWGMDINSIYFANAEIDYRQTRAHDTWKPVRRSRRARARDRARDRTPQHRPPVDGLAS